MNLIATAKAIAAEQAKKCEPKEVKGAEATMAIAAEQAKKGASFKSRLHA